MALPRNALRYPEPETVGIPIPPHLIPQRFRAGFRHALEGGQLDRIEHFRRSFRLGYREGKLYLRELRRRQGVRSFPRQGRVRFRCMP